MADEISGIRENVFLINAPAGSGKTTKIKEMLSDLITKNLKDNILCITYTNRAAEELAIGMDCDRIFFGTIHSFINTLITPFLSHKEIIDLFWDIYEKQITDRINNVEEKSNIKISNQKYIEKYGELSIKILKENICKIVYNETSFNSLYYGGLCHDDLLFFAKEMINRYPLINKKIVKKYQYIFIDEYQDTSAIILKMFYKAVNNTSTQLYLLGDRMQQIYKNYDGSFEEEFKLLNDSISLKTNHRSVKAIIDLLNKIYNDKNYSQELSMKNSDKMPDHEPRAIITKDIGATIKSLKEKHKDFLILFLLNNDKFKEIGANNLYASYGRISKYSFA
ncbi:MAG: UvrD-helicase domain-containing protein, partial [Bacilli bacterium]